MFKNLDDYFLSLPEPEQSCLLFLRQFILGFNTGISEHWHYNTPFYYYRGRWMAYSSYNKKSGEIYLAFIHGQHLEHKKLLSEGRKQVKVFYLDAAKDIDIKSLKTIFRKAITYINGLPEKKKGPGSKMTKTPLN